MTQLPVGRGIHPRSVAKAGSRSLAIQTLQQAEGWWDVRYSVPGEQIIPNRGTGGSALDARYGSALGAYIKGGAAVLPGTSGNYLSTPDAAALDITGDIEIVARVVPPATGTLRTIIAKEQTGSTRSFRVGIAAGGWVYVVFSTDGTATASASATTVLTPGVPVWVKMTRVQSSGLVSFFIAPDSESEPTSWTADGAGTVFAASPIYSGTSMVEIGSRLAGATEPFLGKIHRTIIRNGIGGTTALDVNLASVPDWSRSFTATTGQTVTVNTTGVEASDPSLLIHSGQNYLYNPSGASNAGTTPDQAQLNFTGDHELVIRIAPDQWTTGTQRWIMMKGASEVLSNYSLQLNTNNDLVWAALTSSGVQYSQSPTRPNLVCTDGQAAWWKMTRNNTTGVHSWFYSLEGTVEEPTTWISAGTNTVAAGATLVTNANQMFVSGPGSNAVVGKYYRFIVRNGISGQGAVTVFDANAQTDIKSSNASSFVASTGQVVTLNRPALGKKMTLVTRTVMMFGADDFLEVLDHPLVRLPAGQDMTVLLIARRWGTNSAYSSFIGTRYNGGAPSGWEIGSNNGVTSYRTTLGLLGGGIDVFTAATVDGTLNMAGIYRSDSGHGSILNGVASAPTTPAGWDGTTDNAGNQPLVIGARYETKGQFSDMEFIAAAFFRRTLTAGELTAISDLYLRSALDTETPPLSRQEGDIWTMPSNGHSARWDGTQWQPMNFLSPAVNIAVLLGNSTGFWTARGAIQGEQVARNFGVGGSVLDARYGTSTGVDTNDPLYLPWTGRNYINFPKTVTDKLVAPGATKPTDNAFDYRMCYDRPAYGTAHRIGQWAIYITHNNVGVIAATFAASDASFPGTNATAASVNAVVGYGETMCTRLTWDPATDTFAILIKAGTNITSDTGWTQVSSTVHAGKEAFSASQVPTIGSGDLDYFGGKFYAHYTKINGVVTHNISLANVAALSASATSFVDDAGVTWTINRSTSGRKTTIVTEPIWLAGLDDHLEVPDNALLNFNLATDDMTMVGIFRFWPTTTPFSYPFWTKNTGLSPTGNKGYSLRYNAAAPRYDAAWGDGNAAGNFNFFTVIGVDVPPAGSLQLFGQTVAAGSARALRNNVVYSSTAIGTLDMTNTAPLRIFQSGLDIECVALHLFRRSITTAEIAALNTYYKTV